MEISAETSEVIGTRLGMALAFGGVGLLVGSPIAGAFLNSRGWIGLQVWAGSLVMVSGICLLGVRVLKYGWRAGIRA